MMPNQEILPLASITLRPKNGVAMRLESRRGAKRDLNISVAAVKGFEALTMSLAAKLYFAATAFPFSSGLHNAQDGVARNHANHLSVIVSRYADHCI